MTYYIVFITVEYESSGSICVYLGYIQAKATGANKKSQECTLRKIIHGQGRRKRHWLHNTCPTTWLLYHAT